MGCQDGPALCFDLIRPQVEGGMTGDRDHWQPPAATSEQQSGSEEAAVRLNVLCSTPKSSL